MGTFGELRKIDNNKPLSDSLRFDGHKKRLRGSFSLLKFKDKDTHQFIYFCPSLDVTGYGETDAKALEMIKFSIDDFVSQLLKKDQDEIKKELTELGWKKSPFRNKEYSKLQVDISGELKNFNADESTVQRLQLVA